MHHVQLNDIIDPNVVFKHPRLLMELAKQIELAPKNGDFVVLQDGWSGSWEVGRWAPERSSWGQIDSKPVQIFPTRTRGNGWKH